VFFLVLEQRVTGEMLELMARGGLSYTKESLANEFKITDVGEKLKLTGYIYRMSSLLCLFEY
jgi:hypothetical protein